MKFGMRFNSSYSFTGQNTFIKLNLIFMNILLIMCVNYIPCKVTINFTGLSLADGIYNVIATAEVSTTGTILEGLCGDVTLR